MTTRAWSCASTSCHCRSLMRRARTVFTAAEIVPCQGTTALVATEVTGMVLAKGASCGAIARLSAPLGCEMYVSSSSDVCGRPPKPSTMTPAGVASSISMGPVHPVVRRSFVSPKSTGHFSASRALGVREGSDVPERWACASAASAWPNEDFPALFGPKRTVNGLSSIPASLNPRKLRRRILLTPTSRLAPGIRIQRLFCSTRANACPTTGIQPSRRGPAPRRRSSE